MPALSCLGGNPHRHERLRLPPHTTSLCSPPPSHHLHIKSYRLNMHGVADPAVQDQRLHAHWTLQQQLRVICWSTNLSHDNANLQIVAAANL